MAPFRPNRSAVLLAMISAAFAAETFAAAARVDFVSGAVTVAGSDGRERPLVRGTEIDNGDTVRTAEGGRAQLRFSDGAYVSLQPNSEFSIKEYRFEGKADGNERGFFALAKGAMRTVTGLVGRTNRDRYRITTPTATVGIRGTGGVIQILNDGATLVVGTSGIWSLTNPVGSIDVPAGVSGLAPSKPDQPPQQTSQVPQSGPAPVETQQVIVSQGEQRTDTGAPAILPKAVLTTGDGYAYSVGHDQFAPTITTSDNATVFFDAAGQMTAADSMFKLEAGGSHADFGTDGILAWGRWVGPVGLSTDGLTVKNYSDQQGLHYVVGIPSAVLPTSGTGSYSLAGATRPTYVTGGVGPGSFTGDISVVFGGNGNITGNFTVTMPDAAYGWSWTTGPSVRFAANASGPISGCSSGCTAFVDGFFSGASAERIGVGYHVKDFGTGKDILGAAAFKKN